MIYCDFTECINNKNNICEYKTISISDLCICEHCEIKSYDGEMLFKFQREKLLEKFKISKALKE